MKVKVSELPMNSCFRQGGRVRKKLEEDKVVTVDGRGRVRTRKLRGDPEVEPTPCPLKYFGVGLRRNPEQVVEIGDGNILKNRRRRP